MSTSTVTVSGLTPIYPSGTNTPLLVFNVGVTNVYIGSVSGIQVGANTTVIAPGSSVQWVANTPLFATTVQGSSGTLQVSTEVTNVFDAHALALAIAAGNYQFATATTPAAALSKASVGFPVVPVGFLWLVQRISVYSASSTLTNATVFLDTIDPTTMLDYTNNGNNDIADEASPIVIDEGHSLVCQWKGIADNATGTINIQYQLIQKVNG